MLLALQKHGEGLDEKKTTLESDDRGIVSINDGVAKTIVAHPKVC